MKMSFSIYGITLALLAGTAQGGEAVMPPARANNPKLELGGLSFDDKLCEWKNFPPSFIKDNQTEIEVIVKSLNYAVTPFEGDVEFILTGTGARQTLKGVLNFQPPSIDSSSLNKYDLSKNLTIYLNELNNKNLKPVEKFVWKAENEEALDQLGLESPVLTLLNKNLDRAIKFARWEIINQKDESHQTIIRIFYGYEGDNPTQIADVYHIKHSEESTKIRDIFYLDAQGCLRDVTSILYRPIPKQHEIWAQNNAISITPYPHLAHSKPIKLALYPAPDALSVCLKPEGDNLKKYYRFDSVSRQPTSEYIWTDGTGHFFKTLKMNSVYVPQKTPQQNGNTFDFKDKKNLDHSPCKRWLLTLEKTSIPIILPKIDKQDDLTQKIQFILEGQFQNGYYRLNMKIDTDGGLVQEWIEEPNNPGNSPINITINGVKINNIWAPLVGYPSVRPTIEGDKILFDLSTVLHQINDDRYIYLKKYFTIAYWLEGKTPLIKYCFDDKNNQQKKEACKWLTKILQDQYAVDLGGHAVTIYTPKNTNRSVWAVEFGKTSFEDTTHSIVVPRIGESLKEYAPTLEEVDFLNSQFELSHAVWLGKQDQVKRIKFKNFCIQDFWYHKECNPQLGITVEHIAKTFSKSVGLEILYIPNLLLGDAFGDPFSRTYFHKGLQMNASTLMHLDCSGTHLTHLSPFAGFQLDSKRFIEAIKHMIQLKSINVLNTHLTNQDIVDLAKALQDKRDLVDVRMDMPYWVSTGTELATRLVQENLTNLANSQSIWNFAVNTFRVSASISLSPIVFGIGFMEGDLMNNDGSDFTLTSWFLAKINNLSSLKLKIWGLRKDENHIRNSFHNLRQSANKGPVTIEFVG